MDAYPVDPCPVELTIKVDSYSPMADIICLRWGEHTPSNYGGAIPAVDTEGFVRALVDLDADGRLSGITVYGASRQLPQLVPEENRKRLEGRKCPFPLAPLPAP